MDAFSLSMSRLYVSLLGLKGPDLRLYRTMAATLFALHVNGLAIDQRLAFMKAAR